ncbi:MAG: caspase family protein [Granulosicoccus sp.]
MRLSKITSTAAAASIVLLAGCASTTGNINVDTKQRNPESFMIVDCLLPPQIRRLGTRITYAAPRRPIKTAASVCEIRGGEYAAYDRADFRTALSVWLPAAKEGNADAQTYVGEIYEKGLGVAANYDLAVQWYEEAAAQGNSRALLNLGYLYEVGLGVMRDMPTALDYYRQASGLTDGGIEYVSSLEYANREAAKEKTAQLESQVEQLQQQLVASQRRYYDQKATLEAEQVELEQLRSAVQSSRQQLAAASMASETNARTARSLQRIASLSDQLDAARKEQERLTDKLVSQQLETNTVRAQLADSDRDISDKMAELRSLRIEIEELNSKQTPQQVDSEDLAPALTLAIERAEQLEAELGNVRSSQSSDVRRLAERLQAAEQSQSASRQALDRQNDKIRSLTERNDLERAAYEQQLATLRQSLASSRDEQIRLANTLADTAISQRSIEQDNERLQSTIQKHNRAIQEREAERDQLARQLAEIQQAASEPEAEALATRKELQLVNAELITSREELQRLTSRLRDQQLSAQTATLDAEQRLAALELALQEREEVVARQSALLQELESDVSRSEVKLANRNIENVAGVSNVGLTIDIIEPPLLLTRGAASIPVPPDGQVTLFGRIDPAASLLSFQINGLEQPVNDNGVFRYADRNVDTNLNLVAIDDEGIATRLALALNDERLENSPAAQSADTAIQPILDSGASEPSIATHNVEFGKYHALIIGNNNYESLSKLRTAVNDGRAMERLLREKYGFTTQLLIDASRYDILAALNALQNTLTDQDNLLIYYAGHGELDEESASGYWLPVDADAASSEKWIANSAVTNIVDAMSAKHILIVADSCYSGTLTRSSVARQLPTMTADQKLRWLQAVTRSKVRTVLSSGGVRPVFDGAPNERHSIFAKVLLDELQTNENVLEVYRLFFNVQQKVAAAARGLSVMQTPQYAPIRHSGHEAGEFLFVPGSLMSL